VAPLRRKPTGAFTPKTPWLLYAENPVAPLRRKRNGSYMPEIHSWEGGPVFWARQQGMAALQAAMDELAHVSGGEFVRGDLAVLMA
jgi:hypothetical protein